MTTPALTTPDTSVVDMGVTRDGLTQLRRRWLPEDPWGAVLMVHGIGEHSGRYVHVGAALADGGLATVGYDQRGFGRSGGRRAWVESWSRYHDDLEDHMAELRALGVPVVLFGHSLGGLVALTYVLSPRPAPDRLVLSAPALAAATPRWMRPLARPISMLVPNLRLKSGIGLDTLSRDEDVQRAYEADPLVEDASTTQLGAEIFAAMAQANAGLHELTVPTLVIHGADDRLVPTASSAPLADVPCVQRRVYPGLRHECCNEPEGLEVVADIVDWIRDQLR